MNIIKEFPVIFLLFIWGCSSPTSKKSDITFADYLKTLDTVPLPFEHNTTDSILPELSKYFDTAGFKKYRGSTGSNCSRPLGILYQDDLKIVIVNLYYDQRYIVPVFISYDKTGNEIASLNLDEDTAEYENSIVIPFFKANKRQQIILIDTLRSWKNNKPFHSPSPVVDSTIYHISKKGNFVMDKQKKF